MVAESVVVEDQPAVCTNIVPPLVALPVAMRTPSSTNTPSAFPSPVIRAVMSTMPSVSDAAVRVGIWVIGGR